MRRRRGAVRFATTATGTNVRGRYLAVYLNDHLAGSTAIVELVRRAAREHEGTELRGFLTRLGADISQDRQALRRVMDAAGGAAGPPEDPRRPGGEGRPAQA